MDSIAPRQRFGFLPWLLASVAAHALLLSWPPAGAPVTVAADTADSAPLRLQLLRHAEPVSAVAAQSAHASSAAVPAPVQAPMATAAVGTPKRRLAHAGPPPAATAAIRPANATPRAAAVQTRHAADSDDTAGDTERDNPTAGWSELISLLHAAIDRHKRYPQSALSMGREGSTRVDFRLRPDGYIDDLNIGVSSGVRALDLAAYRAVEAIAPFAGADRYLDRTQRFQVDVVFRIN